MDLRPARKDERHKLARLFQRARNGWDFVPPVPDDVLPQIADDLVARHEELWVAEEDGRLLGFVAIRRSRRHGWEVVEKLYVDPDAQGHGVGSALLDLAKALRPDGLVLWVFQENTGARRFYERHGFRVVTLRFGAAADNMEGEPDALYGWPGVSSERAPAASGRVSSARSRAAGSRSCPRRSR
ncbi:MAG TPA: GNAT family N-acetyltransferase [Gaiellaceae bacterium]|nr:GNAT family N-acetyltransferase [Gaiellaceae bacterium]